GRCTGNGKPGHAAGRSHGLGEVGLAGNKGHAIVVPLAVRVRPTIAVAVRRGRELAKCRAPVGCLLRFATRKRLVARAFSPCAEPAGARSESTQWPWWGSVGR